MRLSISFPETITTEHLEMWFSGSYEAVVPYGDYVICTAWPWDFDKHEQVCVGVVFAFTTGDHGIEGPLELRKVSEISFPDAGHALEWGFNFTKLLANVKEG